MSLGDEASVKSARSIHLKTIYIVWELITSVSEPQKFSTPNRLNQFATMQSVRRENVGSSNR